MLMTWPLPPEPIAASSAGTAVVLAAYLTHKTNTHSAGGFGKPAADDSRHLVTQVTRLFKLSPGLCELSVSVHIVHDLSNRTATNLPQLPRVVWHQAQPTHVPMSPIDQRWSNYARILRRSAWDCAFAIDLTDVMILRIPACTTLRPQLYIGQDNCNPRLVRWLENLAVETRLNGSLARALRDRMEAGKQRASRVWVYNCGTVGGIRSVFEAALHRVVHRLHAHWTATAYNSSSMRFGDMVVWNEVAAGMAPITGYPAGPVNYPLWGALCPDHQDDTGRFCAGCCRHAWVNATRGRYFFGHKLPMSWLQLQRAPQCDTFDMRSDYASLPRC
jgi:hypothetical protein